MSKKSLYCNYAWGHLDFHQKGFYTPCFRFNPMAFSTPRVAEFLPTEAMNSTKMCEIRQQLLDGEWPAGCGDCKYKEEKGIRSYRQESIMKENVTWNGFNPNYDNVIIDRYHEVEIKFSRVCNFFCRHCDSRSNSRFEILGKNNKEIRDRLDLLDFDHISPATNSIAELSDAVIDNLIEHIIPNVSKIMFSGGEPLYHIQHYKFLQKLIDSNTIDTKKLTLEYNTNFSVIKFKNYNLTELWEQFGNVRVTVSLDGTGECFNYFRQNGNYDEIIKNVHEVLTKSRAVKHFSFVCTTTAYHAFYMDHIINDIAELLDDIKTRYEINTNFKLTFVHYPEAIDIVNLNDDIKEFLLTRFLNSYKTTYTDSTQYAYNHAFQEFSTYLKNKKNKNVDFKEIVKLQDQLHRVNAFEQVPRIAEYAYNNKLI